VVEQKLPHGGTNKHQPPNLLNKDGRYNVKKKGINVFDKYSWYHTFLLLP
jgi:hypothetical protein